MPYVKRIARPHECNLPRGRSTNRLAVGSIWACPVDGVRWYYEGQYDGLWQRESIVLARQAEQARRAAHKPSILERIFGGSEG